MTNHATKRFESENTKSNLDDHSTDHLLCSFLICTRRPIIIVRFK